jgi:hypothetical protein
MILHETRDKLREGLTRIDDLVEQNKILPARIAELEGRAGKPPKTPTNSSVPPSHGHKANVAGASGKKESSKGRPGVTRELCSNPDVTRHIYAEWCTCGKKLSASGQVLAHVYDHPVAADQAAHDADQPAPRRLPLLRQGHHRRGHPPTCRLAPHSVQAS